MDERDLKIGVQEENDEITGESVNTFTAWDVIRMILILAAVVALIYGLFYLLKRAGGRRFQDSNTIRVLSSQGLPGNRILHLIEVGKQIFLIAASENNITLISEISDQETIDQLRLQTSAQEEQERKGFSEMLAEMFRPGQSPPGGSEDSINFMKRQKDRLKKM
ncbi:MAG: flagellar biosynthetic protein FliO [Spirochaetales bacterium]|nr:flagellar biosynthetic protein FliO [Spirochaetales bacterium]MCF7937602.1 flagellar biosynthetic protein FliO [Spirochaetales bacterium]